MSKKLTPLPREHYAKVGLFQMAHTHAWTHALGDDHAAKLLSGEIPLTVALAQHQQVERTSLLIQGQALARLLRE